VRPPELLRSRAFRLAMFYMLLFGASTTVLLAFIYWTAGRYVKGEADEFVLSEIAMFRADYDADGPSAALDLLRERIKSDLTGHWLYMYEDSSGRLQASNGGDWPQSSPGSDGFLDLPARRSDRSDGVRAHELHLPDGSRILVGLDNYEAVEIREALLRSMLLGLGFMLLFALGGGLLVTRTSLHQIEAINRVTHEIMAGDLSRRVRVGAAGDEFDRLGRNINDMLQRIQELMGTIKGISDNIAHDLRMPLGRHRGRLDAARAQPPQGPELIQFIEKSIEEVDSILGTFGAMLRIGAVESGTLKHSFARVDLSAIAHDAEQLFDAVIADRQQTLSVSIEANIAVHGNRDLLFQALTNLVDNASKYTPRGGRIELRLSRRGAQAVLEIADNGPGIPPDQRKKVFDRLHRLDASRHTPGSGLGLSLVRAVAMLHDGSCEIEDNHPGARFIFSVPALTGATS